MTNDTRTTAEHDVVYVDRPADEPVTADRYVETEPDPERRGRLLPFIAGFVTALVAVALSIVVFLVVSDADDDGNVNLDVPSVDVDVSG